MGNLHSVRGALAAVADTTDIVISSDPAEILKADHVVLPGVGAAVVLPDALPPQAVRLTTRARASSREVSCFICVSS